MQHAEHEQQQQSVNARATDIDGDAVLGCSRDAGEQGGQQEDQKHAETQMTSLARR